MPAAKRKKKRHRHQHQLQRQSRRRHHRRAMLNQIHHLLTRRLVQKKEEPKAKTNSIFHRFPQNSSARTFAGTGGLLSFVYDDESQDTREAIRSFDRLIHCTNFHSHKIRERRRFANLDLPLKLSLTLPTFHTSPIFRRRVACRVFSLVTAFKSNDASANLQKPPAPSLLAHFHELSLDDFS